ncbi:MAG TPA: pitrilysin family protein [Candidatus Saccharimonadales bacterium]|nr:pitrilysin family protein [Candidatus Saccharimonadales bacterium]
MPKRVQPPGLRGMRGWLGGAAALLLAGALNAHAGMAAPASAVAKAPVHTGLEALEKQVKDFTLPNGMKFVVVERHDAPIFSFFTMVNAGSAQEQLGAIGVAHMMEHMAFKGTPTVGTSDYAKEKPLLDAEEQAWNDYLTERRKGMHADSTRLAALEKAWKDAQEASRKYVVSNEYSKILERNGVQGLNAYTADDVTAYHYSLPSNRLELWAMLEGDRLAHPVFREFYKEREVVYEERRMRVESSPIGRLFDEFIHAAFMAHPYGSGGIGHPSDLKTFGRTDAEAFYRKYYVAKDMTCAIVGDVTADEVQHLAQQYLEQVSDAPLPPPLDIVEPEQKAERRVILEDPAQPLIMIGWHMPAVTDPSYTAYEALSSLLASGSYSRLNKLLVKEKKIAVQVQAFTGFPGEKYPNLFGLLVVPAAEQDPAAVEQAVYDALDEIQTKKPFTQDELDGYKVRTRADMIGTSESREQLAEELAQAQTMYGDWHEFFRQAERVQSVTVDDLLAAMKRTLIRSNRTVGLIVHPKTPAAAGGGQK